MAHVDPLPPISLTEAARLTTDTLLDRLDSRLEGLTEREANNRIGLFGPNILPRPLQPLWLWRLALNFLHLFAILLWVAALMARLAGMPELAVAIVLVVVINGVFSYWQQYKAEQAVEALTRLLPQRAQVRREGNIQRIDARYLSVGDIMILGAGDAVPADARVINAQLLRVDNSPLTGESKPVARDADPTADPTAAVTQLSSILFAGTLVAAGRAEAVVVATGQRTEFGRLARLVHEQSPQLSTLEREMRRTSQLLTALALLMGALFFALGTGFAHLSTSQALVFALGIIVANVPEGLLPTISLALAISVRRMSKRNAIVKRLERVETLGAVTVIVTDKTGTLTCNQVTVREICTAEACFRVSGLGYAPQGAIEALSPADAGKGLHDLLLHGALCGEARLLPPDLDHADWHVEGDPVEAALISVARKGGLSSESLKHYSRQAILPFDSHRRRMTTIHAGEWGLLASMKGSPEEVLTRCTCVGIRNHDCPMDEESRQRFQAEIHAYTQRGLRVLGIAARRLDGESIRSGDLDSEEIEQGFTFLGIVGLEDPPRPATSDAIATCHAAGIRVVMATGDDGGTAAAVGREIGLIRGDANLYAGVELDALDDRAFMDRLQQKNLLFARVTPEHKLRIVTLLQQLGETVAVTGDGVNDAPALRRADIGIAMGRSGTDVARQAADMILMDDNFASIVAAIREGRAVYDNVRKFVTYILASNVPEAVPYIAFVLFRIPLPLTLMQILAVDLGTDLLPALALGAEPPEPDVMKRPPRPRGSRLLDRFTLLRAYAWLGAIEAGLSLFGFFAVYWLAGWRPGQPMATDGVVYVTATTMSLAGIIACQIGNVWACRSATQSVWQLSWGTNRLLLLGIAMELAILMVLMHVPLFSRVFQLSPLAYEHWMIVGTFAPLLLLLEEARKWRFQRRRPGRNDG